MDIIASTLANITLGICLTFTFLYEFIRNDVVQITASKFEAVEQSYNQRRHKLAGFFNLPFLAKA